MKITHSTKFSKKSKEGDGSFLISDQKGGYLWFNSEPKSRYEGWFCSFEGCEEPYRIIESIAVEGENDIFEIKNRFNYIKRRRKGLSELFYISKASNTFVYRLSRKKKIDVFFDVRKSYESKEPSDYEFEKVEGVIVVKFHEEIFLAVKSEKGENIKKIIDRQYSYDKERNSSPFSKNIYHGISLYGKNFVFAVSKSKSDAIKDVKKNLSLRRAGSGEKYLDVLCAQNSLSSLFVSKNNKKGLYAGLPWFFQFWPRDEAISLKALSLLKKEEAKEVFLRLLETSFSKGPGGIVNIDAPGWVLKRADCFLPLLSSSEKEVVKRKGKIFVKEAEERVINGFFVNNPNETWMDSLERSGARIEIQTMLLNAYRLMSLLSKEKRNKDFYSRKEKALKTKTRNAFFDGENLFDGYYPQDKVQDKVLRPNIFIAYYIYPDLLTKEEWVRCFENALRCLWLSWGGLSTIDKSNSNFYWKHTGEDSKSYHQGDSWFFLNNLVAVVLYRVDKERFKDYINKIKKASKKELMWMGAVGCHGEVSSAEKLESRGCLNQAWSSAMYLELLTIDM